MTNLRYIRDLRRQLHSWWIPSIVAALVILLPILSILLSIIQPATENWGHIREYVLVDAVIQSTQLVLMTVLLTACIGVSLAWLVTAYDFPMKRFFSWALLLPLAVPPYIAAYTYSNMFSYTGIVQKTMRDYFSYSPDPSWFGVMSMRGAVMIFTLFLFPYVFLLTKAFFSKQSGSYIENARLLGRGPFSIFFTVALPLCRPALVGSLMLVTFEVLSDFGVVSYFGVQTISTAIFKTWFGMYDVDSAIRLAAWLMVGILGLFALEHFLRSNRKFSASTSKSRSFLPKRLTGVQAGLAWIACSLVFAFSFLIPFVQLIVWATWSFESVWTSAFYQLMANTFKVAAIATAIIMVVSVLVANSCRLQPSLFSNLLAKAVTAGYSIPGAVIAVGVLHVFIGLDHQLSQWRGEEALWLSLSIAMLIFGYVVRFMATGYNAVDSGYERIGTSYLQASRLLGLGITRTFWKVDLPLLRRALLTGAILTFVEILKELPLALLLRPFNFETLATKTYQYASDERIFEASIPSLCIIAVSMLSVLLFHRIGEEK
ncbi:iron ABC transporter permease [Ammoniphilus sp. YIM 78166]|uniref:ABC transporter permease n=1 Tax=Ammoniphilus sp. YIM 78166 TaxID=1644106 RepID=UPI00106F8B15|nr:iron ABC transporter permease [Ammoniphilus sp. YIM 78166]